MMGIETIRSMNREAAERAELDDLQPVSGREILRDHSKAREMPYLGYHLPFGFIRVSLDDEDNHRGVYMGDNSGYGAYFVDNSGFGSTSEPALTFDEFLSLVTDNRFYGIIEVGQFQVKIGVFRESDPFKA